MVNQSIITKGAGPQPLRALLRRRLLGRFGRDQDGATMVEFALVVAPFLMVVFAILETAMMLWTSQVLEDGVTQAARTLLTGESRTLYTNPATQTEQFKNAVCASAGSLVDCSKVTIDVKSYASFSGAQTGTAAAGPVSGGAMSTSGFGYSQPGPSQIVVVRAVLEYPILITTWNSGLANLSNGNRAVVATTTFRSEPF